ncbi:methyl-accepting chemotaxis sensory transducer with Cache sensor [Thauera linaloolentis 47Lol = DSM 12138]|uniref:Methyl-accepting chemotaxis sensory transducer with Cache sensor n=2 Tax=Thauera linaloolentis TaxID=76112 RepID=N6ZDE7_THAL4|nr:methyl-accepting chemotaxis sensory transducer with Cache sensor [Thauera linaloolentis 47Lol = DSM 12138]
MPVAHRLVLVLAIALVGLIVLAADSLYEGRATMEAGYDRAVRGHVEVAHGIVAHFHGLEQSGAMSRDRAQAAAVAALRGLRYEGSEYFWINDSATRIVLHPIRPELEGRNMGEERDADGKYLFREFSRVANESGEGGVDYMWPRPGSDAPQPKMSYVKMFKPWDWIVGTGVYVDDIDREFYASALRFGGIVGGVLVLLTVVAWRVVRSVTTQLGGEPAYAAGIMHRVADGDLRVEVKVAGEADSLLGTLSAMLDKLRNMMGEISQSARQVAGNSHEILEVTRSVSKSSESQTDATAAIAAAVEEMTVSIGQITESAMGAERNSSHSAELADQGAVKAEHAAGEMRAIADTVDEATGRIQHLVKRADEVGAIAGVIKEIAAQTNLLALNAAIEAARAGEQGRGFAVVADEVRKLAERTSTATVQIEQDIAGIQTETQGTVDAMSRVSTQVGSGMTLVLDVTTSLREIASGAAEALQQTRSVAEATAEQRAAATSVAQEVEQIAQMVEGTNVSMHSAVSAVEQLEKLSLDLSEMVARFRV